MEDIYEEMIATSKAIAAAFLPPRFYSCCAESLEFSRSIFAEDQRVVTCREIAYQELRNNFGHGMDHAEKVAVEAGALAAIEGARLSLKDSSRREVNTLAQIAGLLHDLRRGEKDHAQASALAAASLLEELGLSPGQSRHIVEAIANHEAFVEPKKIDSAVGQMISDALYDADKFRWGPDNFTLTLWQMLRFSQAPVVRLIPRFPKGMKGIARIKDTFRTEAGKIYGPEFIDLGLAIGERIYQYLQQRFAAELRAEKKDGEMGG